MNRIFPLLVTAACCGCGAVAGDEASPGNGVAVAAANGNPRVLPPQSHAYGASAGEWGNRWWQWALGMPVTGNPMFDETGERCGAGQSGDVWFLAGVMNVSGTATRDRCVVPAGKALFFPLIIAEYDNVGVSPPFTADQLRGQARAVADSVSEVHATVDGVAIANVRDYRAASPEPFAYTMPATDNIAQYFGIPWSGTTSPVLSDGYWLMLPPLPPGPHTINFGGTLPGFTLDITYHLVVAR